MHPINNLVVMISGANRGIGKAVAETLMNAGCRLSLGVREPDKLADSSLVDNENVLVCRYNASAAIPEH